MALNPEKKFLILYFGEVDNVSMAAFLTWDMLDDRSRIWECHDSSNTYTKTNANIGTPRMKLFSDVTLLFVHECAFLYASINLH